MCGSRKYPYPPRMVQSIFIPLLSSLLYFSFYHLPFVMFSTYFHIFIAFYILKCYFTSYMQNSIHLFLT